MKKAIEIVIEVFIVFFIIIPVSIGYAIVDEFCSLIERLKR